LANLSGIVDEAGNELFRSKETVDGLSIKAAMSETEFNRAWNLLPPEMAAEISECVLQVNPTWDPEQQGE
jgi:hypothetical protein